MGQLRHRELSNLAKYTYQLNGRAWIQIGFWTPELILMTIMSADGNYIFYIAVIESSNVEDKLIGHKE